MQYRLSSLMVLLALGPPALAVLWFISHSIIGMIGWALFMSFFAFWYWRLLHAQSLHPRTRGYPSE
jgi:hypothetical protein